uniref:Uncharacterized protein n=1 Tax=Anguilla anguilla TaxID=7936 RepID=A0A0E9W5P6_ANGAN
MLLSGQQWKPFKFIYQFITNNHKPPLSIQEGAYNQVLFANEAHTDMCQRKTLNRQFNKWTCACLIDQ